MTRLSVVDEAKVVFAVEAKVGNTSIVNRVVRDSFSDDCASTIGAAFEGCEVSTPTGDVILQLWDTAGQEQFRSLTPLYFRNAQVAVLVFDISSQASFKSVQSWLENGRENTLPGLPIYLVGNKADLKGVREVDVETGVQFAAENGFVTYLETSAKTGEGIDDLFNRIGELALERSSTNPGNCPIVEVVDVKTDNPSKCC
jgi:small GTP-binding protein